MRRLLAPVAAAISIMALPTPALAAPAATVTSPAPTSTVADVTPVSLRIQSNGDSISSVELRLSADGRTSLDGSSVVKASCISGCGTATSTWQAQAFEPATHKPFTTAAQCNGYWWIQPSVNGGPFQAGTQFTVAQAPAVPGGFSAELVDEGTVRIQWNAGREPDLVGYAIERSREGGPYLVIGEVGPTASSMLDAGLRRGSYDYRVVALRPDGTVDGKPAAPCDDTGADLRTASASRTVSVGGAQPPVEQPDDTETDASQPGSGGSTGSSGDQSSGGQTDSGQTDGGTTGTDGADADGTAPAGADDGTTSTNDADDDAGTAARPSRPRRPVAPPPSATSSTTRADAPEVNAGTRGTETYYGDDEGWDEAIDYGDAQPLAFDPETGEPIEQSVTRRVPGEVVLGSVTVLDADRLKMLALGLFMATLALHGRRWIREGH